ncbi:MAG: alpha/beta hydrolase [Gammaproteobacteria bacterium]|nr:alpha/beta hydrolase [Gammaproteobacteria bacterium]
MAILVVTNRNITDATRTDAGLFGERVNTKGPSEIRLAWAQHRRRRWSLQLIPEPAVLTEANRPSRHVFHACIDSLHQTRRNCVLYVHGFNKEFTETLEQARAIHDRYGVATVVFSWPSNPGGFNPGKEYRVAQSIARQSTIAFDRTLSLLDSYLHEIDPADCKSSFNLLVHSLGSYLFENFIRDPIFTGQTRLFDNIILHQADVDLDTHAGWVDRLRYSRRVYATINEGDKILDLSDVINPDRLGNTVRELLSDRSIYLDFSEARNVGRKHQLFEEAASVNANVQKIFELMLSGGRAEHGMGTRYDAERNTYVVS